MKVLEADSLVKTFRNGKKTVEAVRGISLSIAAGEVLGFLGPNGCGKTTTIKMLSGLIRRDAGSVLIDGRDPEKNRHALSKIGAVLEGNRNLYWRMTPIENLEYFGSLKGIPFSVSRKRGGELLERFKLSEKMDTQVRMLSRGMQQKVALAVSMVHEPSLLLLDEPTLGLDVETAETVKQLIREVAAQGCAVLLTTHQLGVAEEISDQLAILREGKVLLHEPTSSLIDRFSGEAYRIQVDGEIDPERRDRISELGGVVDGAAVDFMGTSGELWSLLELLRPLPLVTVKKDRANLTGILLEISQGGGDV